MHKKYTYKNGKRYGPYLYESKRVNGKIVTTYLGSAQEKKPTDDFSKKLEKSIHKSHKIHHRKKNPTKGFLGIFTIIILLGVLLLLFLVPPMVLTGHASLDIQADYNPGDLIGGNLILSLNQGELIPSDSKIRVTLADEIVEIELSDLIDDNVLEGNYYVGSESFEGFGEGYGLIGIIETYPDVDFQLQISSESDTVSELPSSGGGGGSSSSDQDSSDDPSIPEADSGSDSDSDSDDTSSDSGSGSQDLVSESDSSDSDQDSSDDPSIPEADSGSDSDSDSDDTSSDSVADSSSDGADSGSGDSDSSDGPGESSSDSDSGSDSGGDSDSGSSDSGSDSGGSSDSDSGGSSDSDSGGSSDSDSGGSSDGGSSITGDVISETNYIVDATVSFDSDFEYNLESDQIAQLVGGSVESNGEILDEDVLDLTFSDGLVVVSTDYSIVEEGFGEDYSGDEAIEFEIDLSDFGLIATNDSIMQVELIYDNETIVETEEDISVAEVEVLEELNESVINESISVEINGTNITVNTTQYGAVLGEPVQWVVEVEVEVNESNSSVAIELPGSATDVVVEIIEEDGSEIEVEVGDLEDYDEVIEIDEEGEEVESDSDDGEADIVIEADGSVVTGAVIRDDFGFFGGLTGRVIEEENADDISDIIVDVDSETETVSVEYYTEAPYAIEQDIEGGKKVKIVGPHDIHYEDVLSFTQLPEDLEIRSEYSVKIYWEEESMYVPATLVDDVDNNGIYDYVEWVAPHLSNQTFNIIVIISAEHLDENRTFISDIYEEVREQDDNWSETISEGHYVRVAFEVNLTSDRDITIWPRTVSGNPRIEIYEINESVIVSEFESIIDNEYNKVYLDDLVSESQDKFDLLILDGDVEFDHIIDPTAEFFEDCNNIADWTVTSCWAATSGVCDCTTAAGATAVNMTSTGVDLSSVSNANLTYNYSTNPSVTYLRFYVNNGSDEVQLANYGSSQVGQDEFALEDYVTLSSSTRVKAGCQISAGRSGTCTWDHINITSYNDNSPPQVTFIRPQEGIYYPVTKLHANISLNENGSAKWSIDLGSTNDTFTSDEGSTFGLYFNDTITASEGINELYVYANDTNGNNNYSESVNFSIDSNIPQISFVNPTPSSGNTAGDSIYINVTANDTGSDIFVLTDFNNSLILWYDFDSANGSGEPTDLSSYSNNGTLHGGSVIDPEGGYFGNGTYLNGSRHVNISDLIINPSSGNFSVFVWGKVNPGAGNQVLLSQVDGVGTGRSWLVLQSDGDLVTALRQTSGTSLSTSGTDYANSQWHHFGFVYNGTSRGLWVDGALAAADAESTLESADGNLILGLNKALANGVNGSIDEFVIINRTLSSGEIGALYNATVNRYEKNFTNLAYGDYPVRSYARDRAGNSQETEIRSITLTDNILFPYTVLNSPANGEVFMSVGGIVLNATVYEPELDNMTVKVYASKDGITDLSKIVYQERNVTNGSEITYNYTSPIIDGDDYGGNIRFLAHLDKNEVFGENDTHVNDFSNNINGTIFGSNVMINYSEGKFGGSLYANTGGSQGINLTDYDDFTGVNYTYMAWLKPIENGFAVRYIMDKRDSGGSTGLLAYRFQGQLSYVIEDASTVNIPNYFNVDEWVHFVMTVEGDSDGSNEILVYRNGVLNHTTSLGPVVTDNNVPAIIGNTQTLVNPFIGHIDEFVVINKTLNSTEIQQAYEAGQGTYYWEVNVSDGQNINTSSQRNFVIEDTEVSGCGVLDVAGTTYTQTANIVPGVHPCINITAPNIVFDGAGYYIANPFLDATGVYSDQLNTTIRNTNITMSNNIIHTNAYGINLVGSNGSTLYNNTLFQQTISLSIDGSHNVGVSEIRANGSSLINVKFSDSSNISFEDSNSDSCNSLCLDIQSSVNVNVSRINISAGNGIAIDFSTVENSSVQNTVIENTLRGIRVSDQSLYINLTNVTIMNTGGTEYALLIDSGSNYTRLIDMPHIENYTIIESIVYFEDTEWGVIEYLDNVNGSGINLTNDVRISNNSAVVETGNNNGLNESANIILRNNPGAAFNTPELKMDGLTCESNVCYNFTSLTASNVQFNVSHWSNFSLGESKYNLIGCTTLDEAGATYTQIVNITPDFGDACMNITADNVVYIGDGYSIKNDTYNAYGIFIQGANNVTILNVTIDLDYSTALSRAIQIASSNDTTIRNAKINGTGYALRTDGVNYRLSVLDSNFSNAILFLTQFGGLLDSEFVNNSFTGGGTYDVYVVSGSNITVENSSFGYLFSSTSATYLINNSVSIGASLTSNSLVEDGSYVGSAAIVINGDNNNITRVDMASATGVHLSVTAGADNLIIKDSPYIGNYSFNSAGNLISVINSTYGEIKFLSGVNGSGGNLTNDIRIEDGVANVETGNNIGLNSSANVTLYNNPSGGINVSILRNDELCPSGVCNNFTSLTASTVQFNVSYWTNYSLGDKTSPHIEFVSPTPNNGSTQTNSDVTISINSSDENGMHYSLVDVNNDLLLWLKMEDINASGDPVDLSSYNHSAALNGAAFINSTSRYGSAMHLDGTNDFIRTGLLDLDMSSKNLSVMAWINTKDISGPRYIFGTCDTDCDENSEFALMVNSSSLELLFEGVTLLTGGSISLDTWYLVGFTYNYHTEEYVLYLDGIPINSTTSVHGNAGESVLTIGSAGALNNDFLGAIDDVFVFNRTLNGTQIESLYNATTIQYYWNYTGMPSGNNTFTGYSVDQFGNLNQTIEYTVELLLNIPPTTPTPVIQSNDLTNRSSIDLRCLDTLLDSDADSMNVTVEWYNGSSLMLLQDYNSSYANGTAFIATLDAGNITRSEKWSCGIRTFDGESYSAWANSSQLTVVGTAPSVTLQSPANNAIITNRTPLFNWTFSDVDGDTSIGYEFNISLVAASTCADQDVYAQNLINPNYTLGSDLSCFSDNNDYYIWSVRANDTDGVGDWSSAFALNISALIDITLPVSEVVFGSMSILETNDTTDDSPPPIVVRNDGNALVDITVNATDMWVSVANPSIYYQYKFDNVTGEDGAFNWSASQTTFAQMPILNTTSLVGLEYIDSMDSAELDLYIQVPPNEPPGARNSTVMLISSLGEGS